MIMRLSTPYSAASMKRLRYGIAGSTRCRLQRRIGLRCCCAIRARCRTIMLNLPAKSLAYVAVGLCTSLVPCRSPNVTDFSLHHVSKYGTVFCCRNAIEPIIW